MIHLKLQQLCEMKIMSITTLQDSNSLTLFYFPHVFVDFRVNKYCGELLQIGNEDWDLRSNINWQEIAKSNHHDDVESIDDGSGEGMFNGPRTEALRHKEMNYYKVTNLKIMKADDKNESIATASPQAKNLTEIKLMKQSDGGRDKAKSKVFSQVS